MYNGGEDLRAQLTSECRSHRYGVYTLELPFTAASGIGALSSDIVLFQRGEIFLWTGLVVTDVRANNAVSASAQEYNYTISTDSGDERSFPPGPTSIYSGISNNYPDFSSYFMLTENDTVRFTAKQLVARNRFVQFTLFGIVYVR